MTPEGTTVKFDRGIFILLQTDVKLFL